MMMGTGAALLVVLLWAVVLGPAAGARKQPPAPLPAVVQALKPTGLRISVLDEEGMDLVIINANINVPIQPNEKGEIDQTILRVQDGFWTLEDTSHELGHEDIVYYWVNSSHESGQRKFMGHHVISELVDPSCKPSITTVNGRPACKGALVFEDNFDTVNKTNWRHNVEIWYTIFSVFVDDEEHSFVKDGVLHIRPTVVTDESQLSDLLKLERCKSPSGREACENDPLTRKVLPPVRSAWLTSNSSFKFVRTEVRAKPAAGDWLFSGIYLFPLKSEYGGGLYDGEIVVMRARGNEELRNGNGANYGANEFHAQVGAATCSRRKYYVGKKNLTKGIYSDCFHTYAVTWTPTEIKLEVDGEVFKTVAPPRPDGFLGIDRFKNCNDNRWEKGTFMAPFDQESTLDITLDAGGVFMFPDDSKSRKHAKPWRNRTPSALLDFWQARDAWLPTWKGDLEIDYVKVWAL